MSKNKLCDRQTSTKDMCTTRACYTHSHKATHGVHIHRLPLLLESRAPLLLLLLLPLFTAAALDRTLKMHEKYSVCVKPRACACAFCTLSSHHAV
jgi:hypothetical protein